jgi:hypothetical protein
MEKQIIERVKENMEKSWCVSLSIFAGKEDDKT